MRNTEEGIYVGGQRISDRIDMRTIEDLMMDEAIRRSLAESESISTSSALETLPPAPTSSSSTAAVQRNSVRHIDDIESVYIEMRYIKFFNFLLIILMISIVKRSSYC